MNNKREQLQRNIRTLKRTLFHSIIDKANRIRLRSKLAEMELEYSGKLVVK
jgi:hypothetical protein